eukprot:jgi/Botrbrau1/14938/Bobra.0018s0042.1
MHHLHCPRTDGIRRWGKESWQALRDAERAQADARARAKEAEILKQAETDTAIAAAAAAKKAQDLEATLRISKMEVAALEEVGETEIAETKSRGVERLRETVAIALKEAANAEALAQARANEREQAERAALDAHADAERKEETRKQMQEAATVAASATRWRKRAGQTAKESEVAKQQADGHEKDARAADLEAERADQQARQLEAAGHFEAEYARNAWQEAARMAVAAKKWCQQATEARAAAEESAEIANRKRADADAELAEANAAHEEATRLKDDLDYLLLISDKTAVIHRLKVVAEKATWDAQQAAIRAAGKEGEARHSLQEAEAARDSAAMHRNTGRLQDAAASGSAALRFERAAAAAKDEAAGLLPMSHLKAQEAKAALSEVKAAEECLEMLRDRYRLRRRALDAALAAQIPADKASEAKKAAEEAMEQANTCFQEAKTLEEQSQKAQNEALKATLAGDMSAAANATSKAAALKQKAAEATQKAREDAARQIKLEETAAACAKEATEMEEEVTRHHSALLHVHKAARTADAAVEEGKRHAAAVAAQSEACAKAHSCDTQLPALREALAAALEMQQPAEAGGNPDDIVSASHEVSQKRQALITAEKQVSHWTRVEREAAHEAMLASAEQAKLQRLSGLHRDLAHNIDTGVTFKREARRATASAAQKERLRRLEEGMARAEDAIKDAEESIEKRKASWKASCEASATEQEARASMEEADAADSRAAISEETARKLADGGAAEAVAASITSSRWRAQALNSRRQGSESEQKAAVARRAAEEQCAAAARLERRSWLLDTSARQVWDQHAAEEEPHQAEETEEASKLREQQARLHEKAGSYIRSALAGLASVFAAEDQFHALQGQATLAHAEAASKHMLAATLQVEASTEEAKLVRARARRKSKAAAEAQEAGNNASLRMGDCMAQVNELQEESKRLNAETERTAEIGIAFFNAAKTAAEILRLQDVRRKAREETNQAKQRARDLELSALDAVAGAGSRGWWRRKVNRGRQFGSRQSCSSSCCPPKGFPSSDPERSREGGAAESRLDAKELQGKAARLADIAKEAEAALVTAEKETALLYDWSTPLQSGHPCFNEIAGVHPLFTFSR